MQGKADICGVNTSRLTVLTQAETDMLLRRAKEGDERARQRLIEGEVRRYLRDNSVIRVSRSIRDVAIRVLQCKEVICVKDGRRLGYVEDVLVEVPEGTVCAIVVPGSCRYLGIAGRNDDYVIPWNCICRIGSDIVLADVNPENCRVKSSLLNFREKD